MSSADTGTTHIDTSSSSTGPTPICGDGNLDPDEECDDMNDDPDDGCKLCTRDRFIFASSTEWQGFALQGLYGADQRCHMLAGLALLPNALSYRAWLSDSKTPAADRILHSKGRYTLVNGIVVAADWDALTSGTIDHAINVNEMGETMIATAWTGTDITGMRMPSTGHCTDWTYNDSDQTGWLADASATDTLWTRGIESDCGGFAAIYCVEQP